MSTVYIFDFSGNKIAELEANVRRSWAINRVGDAEFALSIYDKAFKASTIQFGNWILVKDPPLPDWVGMIDPERSWSSGSVSIRAFSAYQITKYRRIVDDKKKAPPGELARWGLGHINTKGSVVLECQTVDSSGAAIEEVIGETTVMSFVDGLLSRTSFELGIEGVMTNNVLSLQAAWVKRLGWETGALLAEGIHFEAGQGILLEQGDLYNDLFGISNGANAQNRKTSVASNADAARVYGPRSGVKTFDSSESGTIETLTKNMVDKKAWPRRTVSVSVANIKGIWQYLALGNVVWVECYTMGFTGSAPGCRFRARITGLEMDDSRNALQVAADEVQE
jgi:hypothetical protein